MSSISIPIRLSIVVRPHPGSSVGFKLYACPVWSAKDINCATIFRRSNREIAPFSTSTRCSQVIARNCRPWKFLLQIPYLPSLSNTKSREIAETCSTFPCDYSLNLRHYGIVFFIVICFLVSPEQWLSSPLRRHVFGCC